MASVFELLDHEWRRLRADRVVARALADVRAAAGGAATMAEVEAFVRQASPPEADQVLLALVRRAVVGDALAARVLLQLLLPGTRALARRWWAIGDAEEREAAAVAAVYHRIRSYPIERRPGRVAANVLMDAARELRQCISRVITVPVTGASTPLDREPGSSFAGAERSTASPVPNPAVELAEVLRDAMHAGVVDPDDAALIARSRIGGERVADIAAHRGQRPRTLWDRRQRAEQALAAAHAAAS
ncbi:MAG: hypothetical protein ACRD2C_22790 [Acidimicrobiales bacterium]